MTIVVLLHKNYISNSDMIIGNDVCEKVREGGREECEWSE